MKNYKNLTVWQDSHELVFSVYKETKGLPREEVYGITSQLRQAAASIPANIAEGFVQKTPIKNLIDSFKLQWDL